jgi:hypothetical protein
VATRHGTARHSAALGDLDPGLVCEIDRLGAVEAAARLCCALYCICAHQTCSSYSILTIHPPHCDHRVQQLLL